MKLTYIFLSAMLVCCQAYAQSPTGEPTVNKGYKYNNFYDLNASVGQNQAATAIGWAHLHGIGKKQKFKIGYGVRFTSYFSGKQNYITAPAKLTSKAEGPQIFLDGSTHNENLDTLAVRTSQVNMLNLSIHLLYSFNEKWDVSFNIDGLGFSFGDTQSGVYNSYTAGVKPQPSEKAKPTKLNALLVSDNDIGNLNSEFFVRYWLNPKWGVRLGYTFLFSEYTTNRTLNFDNDRFRYKSSMALLGITYSPFR